MREGNVKGFDTILRQCSRLGAGGGVREAVAVMRAARCEFIRMEDLQPDPDPLRHVDAKGNLVIGAYVRHPALRPSRTTLDYCRVRQWPADSPPWASFSFGQKSRRVAIRQDASLEDQRMVDPLALGQLLLACDLCPLLEPAYGWIDERGANLPRERESAPTTLRYVFWANIFGPEYVRFLGREFLSEAPGWRLADLPGGGMLYVVTESYLEWWHTDRDDVLEYFRQRVPDIQLYRAEEGDW